MTVVDVVVGVVIGGSKISSKKFVVVAVVVVVTGVVMMGAFLQHILRSFLQVLLVLSSSILVPPDPVCLTSKREPSVMGFTSISPFSPFTTFPTQF